MSNLPQYPANDEQFTALEQLIANSKEYVVPSDDLRGRVLESARSLDHRRVQLAKIRNLILFALSMWIFVLTVYFVFSRSRQPYQKSADVEQQSMEYSQQYRYSKDWGMVDAVQQSRGVESIKASP